MGLLDNNVVSACSLLDKAFWRRMLIRDRKRRTILDRCHVSPVFFTVSVVHELQNRTELT